MRSFFIASALAVSALVAGCGTQPIYNVEQTATTVGKPLTQDQVKVAIIRAGAALGWQMKEQGPGMLEGTLTLRAHTAVISIPYSATSYSIKYRSSVNLEESGGKIHKNYNGWIQNLQKGINTQLALL
jgi:hypothetical protein